MNEFEEKAKKLLINNEIDIYRPHRNSYKYHQEIILLRVLDGNYYKENPINQISGYGDEVQAFFKYKLLKSYLVNKLNEFPPKITALFEFIAYLHSRIESFNQFNDLIEELEELDEERNKFKPESNYKDKLKYDQIQADIEDKFKTLQNNTANCIKAKAKELNLSNFNNEPSFDFSAVETEIRQLKRNFRSQDLPIIFKHKELYLKYRNSTHKTFLSLGFFFNELDRLTKSLFDYFKDSDKNEFEAFETKGIEVNSIAEAIIGFNQGKTKFIIPTPMDERKGRLSNKLADFYFFQIKLETHQRKVNNNDGILTPENWEQQKETFISQRMAIYKDSYTLEEKLKLELSALEKLPINETDYQVLKDRYKAYLEQKQTLSNQSPTTKNDTIRLTAKHYVLAFLLECNAKGKGLPVGRKKEIEKIGNKKMGPKKGNRFYKVFNELVNKDLNVEKNLIEIGGENWRKIIKDISEEPEEIEAFLQTKQL
ncbi:hypothetical protein [Mangrovimonas sp. ST2L15]|uniref:hypothetical protein n=1 Tax=Mangrovimonas sp. ST2L15 TaxID=1645916 RepID=UPI0012FA25C5|nr:hypothetical protein [Mangrovimonas sp. ST2L15]